MSGECRQRGRVAGFQFDLDFIDRFDATIRDDPALSQRQFQFGVRRLNGNGGTPDRGREDGTQFPDLRLPLRQWRQRRMLRQPQVWFDLRD